MNKVYPILLPYFLNQNPHEDFHISILGYPRTEDTLLLKQLEDL